MMKPLGYLFVLMVAGLAALTYWVLPRVHFESDIMALFPENARQPAISHANGIMSAGLTDKLFFLLSSSDWEQTRAAAPAFAKQLRSCDCIDEVIARQDASEFAQVREHYQQYSPVILSRKDRVLLKAGQAEVLANSALREIMANPARAASESLVQDPFGTTEDFLEHLQKQIVGRGSIDKGYVYFTVGSDERRHLLVVADLAGSAYALNVQQRVGAAISAAEAEFAGSVPDAEIIKTGTFFFAQAGTHQARQEISTVGLGSVLGIIVLFLAVFRSPTLLVLAMLPIGAGVLAGLLMCSLVFGSVHIIALVFGASLIGVSIDYSLHFLCKRQAMEATWQPEYGLKKLLPGLTLGLVTSVAGYLGFTAAGFPGFRQVAVFSCAGLIAAYLVVVGFYPWALFKPSRTRAPRWVQRVVPRWLAGAQCQLRRLKYPEVALPLAVLLGIGIWQLQTQDDIRLMQAPSAELRAEEERFQELVGSTTAMQYLLVKGNSEEALLQQLEELDPRLQRAVTADHISGYLNLARWLPSVQTQKNDNALLREHLVSAGLLEDYLNTLGLRPDARKQLEQKYSQPHNQFLTLDESLPVLNELLERPLYFRFRGDHYSFIWLDGLSKNEPLRTLANEVNNVYWVNPVEATNKLLEHYRFSASWVLLGAYLAVYLVLVVRYRWRGAFAVLAPPLLASLFTLGTLAALGVGFSVFNAMALLLVLGIGIDYTLFLRESAGRGFDTLFAIALASMTTVLSFGLLSLSATHAIFSFGLTVLVGIVMSFLLSPLALPPTSYRTK